MDANLRREEFKEKLMGRLPDLSLGYSFYYQVLQYEKALQSLTNSKECTIYKDCTECKKHQECLNKFFSSEEVILSILKECREMVVETPAETTKAKIEMRRD